MPDRPLYERDFYAWTVDQSARRRGMKPSEQLTNHEDPLDFVNLAEDIEDLGRSQRRRVERSLINIAVYLLKLQFSRATEPRRHWPAEIRIWRADVISELADSPSIRPKLDIDRIWQRASHDAAVRFQEAGEVVELPDGCPYTLDQLLDPGFFPADPSTP